MKKNWPVLLVFVLALLPWISRAGDFFYNLTAQYSDLTISHLPNAVYLLDAIRTSGEVPFWSNLIMSGAPFTADPLAGLWYPVGWIAYLLPQPLGFNLTALLHILWGGLGMFSLLSALGVSRRAALMGGLAFLLMPKLFSHLAAGHVTLVYAVSWTPWIFLAEHRRNRSPSTGFSRIVPGILLGVVFLADPRWGVYVGAGWLGFYIWQNAHDASKSSFRIKLKKWLPDVGLQAVLALCLSAVLLPPMLEFTRLSSRVYMTPADVLAFSLPPTQLAGLVLPNIGGYWEWQIYPGAFILTLVVYALFVPAIRKKAGFWLVLTLVAAVVSLGSFWPFAENLAELPGVSLLRVPSRAWFLAAIGLIVTAVFALDDILAAPKKLPKPDPMVLLLPLAALAVFLTLGLLIIGQTPPMGFIWGAVALSVSVVLLLFLRRGTPVKYIFAVVIVFVAIDLGGINWFGVNFRSAADVFSEGQDAARFLASQEGDFRVYSPSYSIPQHTAAAAGLELIDGINPLHLKNYSDFMSQASGTFSKGYSVTIPDFAAGDPAIDNKNVRPDTEMLGLLNGKYIVSEFELNHPQLSEIWHHGNSWIYENQDALPRAWVQEADAKPGFEILREVQIDHREADNIVAQAEGPGLLVFSTPDYPGWEVQVDGVKAVKLRVADLLIGVDLESGTHQITLTFKPATVYWGQAISLLTWIVIIMGWVMAVRKKSHEREN